MKHSNFSDDEKLVLGSIMYIACYAMVIFVVFTNRQNLWLVAHTVSEETFTTLFVVGSLMLIGFVGLPICIGILGFYISQLFEK